MDRCADELKIGTVVQGRPGLNSDSLMGSVNSLLPKLRGIITGVRTKDFNPNFSTHNQETQYVREKHRRKS